MVNALQVSELTVCAPGAPPLLNALNFALAPGERVGLIGASGCGKSLTAAALTGLLRPPLSVSGKEFLIHGHDALAATPAAWRDLRGREIFQVFQSPGTALTPARRIRAQLAEAARIAGVPANSAIAQALEAVTLDARTAELFPYQLSGGMKQRVLIAMALILRPRVLIADEPTTGLDVLTERDILTALNTMADETGAAVLFISHDLRAVANIASRTLVMEHGKLVEDAPITELAQSSAKAARRLAEAAHALQAAC